MSSPTNASYKIVLPIGKQYGFHASVPGYIAINENLETNNITKYTEINRDLYLTPIEKGQSVVLNNIFFEKGKAILLNTSFSELDQIVKLLVNNPKMKIRIDGHTDNIRGEAVLLELSQNRAYTIKDYLVSKGIKQERIETKAFGSSKPISSNDREETRKINRRVEFTVLDF